MVFLYNKITKKWSFFYLHLLTGCVIMALVEKGKTNYHSEVMAVRLEERSVRKGKGLLC